MKKFAVVLLFIIAILLVILLLKMNGGISLGNGNVTTTSSKDGNTTLSEKYSNEEIKELILKGKENLDEAENLYYEIHSDTTINKYYCKGTKFKRDNYFDSYYSCLKVSTSSILDLDEGCAYLLDHKTKTIQIINPILSKYGFQTSLLNKLYPSTSYVITFTYIKDEKIDGKDCIFIKENRLDPSTYELKYPDSYTWGYWLEKSTGFVIGRASMSTNETSAIPESLTKNITYGIVQDSDFELPKNYKTESYKK